MSFTGFHICTPAHQLGMLWEAVFEQVVNGGRVFGQCNLWLLPVTHSTTWSLPCKQAAVTGSSHHRQLYVVFATMMNCNAL